MIPSKSKLAGFFLCRLLFVGASPVATLGSHFFFHSIYNASLRNNVIRDILPDYFEATHFYFIALMSL